MTTEDVASNRREATSIHGRRLRAGAMAVVAAFVLSACGTPDGYIDAWWDNGDPIYAPFKENLFDEEGIPTCTSPTSANGFESRARAYSNTGGLVNLFVFEVLNDEPDPNVTLTGLTQRQEQRERTRRERLQGSLDTMYQMTHPDFDARFGVESPEDMGAIKAALAARLKGIDPEEGIYSYVERSSRWLQTPEGRLTVSSIADVDGFMKEQGLPLQFDGLNFEYLLAIDDSGDEFLMVTDKETSETKLYTSGEIIDVDENSEFFTLYQVVLPDFYDDPSATITLVYDQCPPYFGDSAARYWVYDYQILDPVAR